MIRNVMKQLSGGLILILACCIPVGIFELAGQLSFNKDYSAIERNPDHRNPPNDRGLGTNSDGIRSDREAGEFGADSFNVIFLGDSFVYGAGLPPNESVPAQWETQIRNLLPEKNIKIANFGWISSSPLLSYRLFRDIGAKYHPKLVILGLDMTDFHDDFMYRNLLERRGVFVLSQFMPSTFLLLQSNWRNLLTLLGQEQIYRAIFDMQTEHFFAMNHPLSVTANDLTFSLQNIQAIHDWATLKLGARFILVVFPRGVQYNPKESPLNWERGGYSPQSPFVLEPFRFLAAMAPSLPYPVYSLLPAFQQTKVFPTCFRDDPHWNTDGAAVAAQALTDFAMTDHWFEPAN